MKIIFSVSNIGLNEIILGVGLILLCLFVYSRFYQLGGINPILSPKMEIIGKNPTENH